MSGKFQDKDTLGEELVILGEDLLNCAAEEPLPQHLIALAKQIQAALEQQSGEGPGDDDAP